MQDLTDIGANLCHNSYDLDRAEVLSRARERNVNTILITGSCLDSANGAAAMAGEIEGVQLYATAGLHPHFAADWTPTMAARFKELASHPRVVALGECGLDYNRNYCPHDLQRSVFEQQLDLAIETQMPLFLHQRDAHDDFMALLKPRLPELNGVVVHCFTGSAADLADYVELDVYVGITGWICDERRGAHLLDCVGQISDQRLLIETDAPYLLPRTLKPKPKSRRNEPMYLPEVAATVAQARGQTAEHVARITHENARRLFRLP